MNSHANPGERPERSPAMEGCVDEEVLEWYRMTPQERWAESMRLWDIFYLLGGRLESNHFDSQGPFYDVSRQSDVDPSDEGPSLTSLRRISI
jgi:hypothetical protein